VLWGLAYRMSDVTNGDNGIAGLTRPMPFGISLDSPASFYWFALIVASFALVMMAVFVSSAFGSSLKGVRDQPRRMAALGFNPWLIKWITFVYAGFWGGVSGLLYVYYNKYIHPTSLSTTSSAEALLGVIAGGCRRCAGLFLGQPTRHPCRPRWVSTTLVTPLSWWQTPVNDIVSQSALRNCVRRTSLATIGSGDMRTIHAAMESTSASLPCLQDVITHRIERAKELLHS